MIQRKLLPLVLLLLLLSVGLGLAQSSTNFNVQRFVTMSGGSADSASYTVKVVIGQPATGVVDSADYTVSAGFLHPPQPGTGFKVWLPAATR